MNKEILEAKNINASHGTFEALESVSVSKK